MQIQPANMLESIKRGITELRPRYLYTAHLFFAFIIFSPFFLSGHVIVGSSDNMFHHMVNMIINLRNFQSWDLGLWNPYILGGIDFSASTHNFIYSPINWIIFAFPEKYFFIVMTLRMFIETWLLGVFGFLFFKEEIGSTKWAFFASIIYQLNGYLFFSITTYANLTITLFTTIALYVIWTFERRRSSLSYLYLTFCTATIILSGNIMYAFSAMLILSVLFSYRRWSDLKRFYRPSSYLLIFLSGCITGITLSMVRLLPLAVNLASTGVSRVPIGDYGAFAGSFLTRGYLGITAFVPETLGVNFTFSRPVISKLFRYETGMHGQFHAFTYFGAISILLVFFAALAIRERKALFWLLYFLVTTIWFLRIRPFSDIIDIFFYPVKHDIIAKMMIPISVAATAGFAGMYLESCYKEFNKKIIRTLAVISAIVLSTVFLVHLYTMPELIKTSKLVMAAAILLIVLGVCSANRGRGFKVFTMGVYVAAAATGLFFLFRSVYINELYENGFFVLVFGQVGMSIVSISALYLSARLLMNDRIDSKGIFYLCLGPVLLLFVAILLRTGGYNPIPDEGIHLLAILGSVRFILVTFFLLMILNGLKSGRFRPEWLFPFLVLVVLFDLLPYNKVYSYQIMEPFSGKTYIYPSRKSALAQLEGSALLRSADSVENLVKNGSFEQWSDATHLQNWNLGGKDVTIERVESEVNDGKYAVTLRHGADDTGNLYFDFIGEFTPGQAFTMGAWIKASAPGTTRLFLTDEHNGTFSAFHTGSGKWEWLSLTHSVRQPAKLLRLHISVAGPGSIVTDDVILAEGSFKLRPKSNTMHMYKSPNRFVAEKADLLAYRVNSPHRLTGISATEMMTNMPSLYGIRSYGGVNSVLEKRHRNLLMSFTPSAVAASGMIAADIKNERYLDLLGCRYDADKNGLRVVRPTALSRVMLFKKFEVIEGDSKILKRLKEEGFIPRREVILSKSPVAASSSETGQAVDLKFTQPSPSVIETVVNSDIPAIVLFGDSYAKGWKAYVNGVEQPVIQANYNFMAVEVPAGESTVLFRFEPKPFVTGVRILLAGAVLTVVCVAGFYLYDRKRLCKRG